MESLEVTTMMSRGQIVIPQSVREALHLGEGVKFVVVGDRDEVILKRILSPSINELKALLTRSRAFARKNKLKKSGLATVIRRVRKGR